MNTDCQESNPHRGTIEPVAPALAASRPWADAAQKIAAHLLRSSEFFSIWLKRDRHWRSLDRLSNHTLKDIGLAQVDIHPSRKDLS